MSKTRKSKNTPYVCPECFNIFKIENKSIYPFIYKKKVFCKRSCLMKYKKELEKKKILGIPEENDDRI